MATLRQIIDGNQDIKRLFEQDGFELSVRGAHLLIHSVPYLDANLDVRRGVLIMQLNFRDDIALNKPADHVAFFAGEYPHYADRTPLKGIVNSQGNFDLSGDVAQFCFSSKPDVPDADYWVKVHRYVDNLSRPAKEIDAGATAQTRQLVACAASESPFVFPDTNSARAQITSISDKLNGLLIAIVGLGGTGSYVLDAVSKAPVKEIHLWDDDEFSLHNAFRAPGAPTRQQLQARPFKVDYLTETYSRIHKGIVPHREKVTPENAEHLSKMSFVFLCMDPGPHKAYIVQLLVRSKVPFVDTGIGIEAVNNKLLGTVNTITVTPDWNDHAGKIPVQSAAADDLYASNIQIVELNMLNAVAAVIRWKKHFDFYVNERNEHGSAYTIGPNMLTNEDTHPQICRVAA